MTFEEAKKILEKEGFYVEKATRPCAISKLFTEYEDPTICEAMQVVNSAGYFVCMEMSCFDERKARLKKEYGKSTKAPGSSENRIKEDSGANPALKESASQFNDALLDEQAKKIKRLGKEISRLNGIIHDKNEEIKRKTKGCCELVAENVDLKEDLRNTESLLHDTREANSRNLDTCFKNEDLIDELKKKLTEKTKLAKKYAKELSDSSLGLCKLEKQLKDKNAVLSDVAEELRLTKIREKNLAELGLKYVGENEKLKKELADKVVDKIDAQVLKSAESALAEKDEVIADLGKELAATKKQLEEKTKLVEIIRNGSKEYCDYGVAANEFIKKLASLYVLAGNTGIINDEILERCKNYQSYGFPANCNRETKKEINDIASGKTKAVGVDVAEEGGDQSGKIVLCGKDFGKILKDNEEAAEELSKVLNDVIDQFLLFGEIIIKEEK